MPQGQNRGIGDKILRGLQTAALFAEPPEHRLRRLALENRVRATDAQIANQEERTDLARRRDERFKKESERRQQNQDLQTRLSLAASGVQLTPEQRQQREAGELLGIDLGSGVAVGPQGGNFVDFQDDQFFVPGRQAQSDLDLQQALDREQALQELRNIPLPGKIGSILGMEEGTKVNPAAFDDLLRAAGSLQPDSPTLDKSTFTDAQGNTDRVFINPETGQIQQRVRLGTKPQSETTGRVTPAEQRARKREQRKQQIVEIASTLLLENGNDPSKAIADIERQARFDETGFLKKNAVAIRAELRKLERSSSKGGGLLDDAFDEQQSQPATLARPSNNGAQEFEAFLRRRGGG